MSWTVRRPLTGPEWLDELIVPAALLGTDPLAAPWNPQPGDTEQWAPADPTAVNDPAAPPTDDGSIPLAPPPAPPDVTDPATDGGASPAPVDGALLWATAADGVSTPVLVVLTPDGRLTATDVRGWNVSDGNTSGIIYPGVLGNTVPPIRLVNWQDLLAESGAVTLPPADLAGWRSASIEPGFHPTDGIDVTDPSAGGGVSPLLADGSWSWATQAADVSGWDVPGVQTYWHPVATLSAAPHLPFMTDVLASGLARTETEATAFGVVYKGDLGSDGGTTRVIQLVTPTDGQATTGSVTVTPAGSAGGATFTPTTVITVRWQSADDDLGAHPTDVTVKWDTVAGTDSVLRVTAATDKVVLTGLVDVAALRSVFGAAAPPAAVPVVTPANPSESARAQVAPGPTYPAAETSFSPARLPAAEFTQGVGTAAALSDTADPRAAAVVVAEVPAPGLPAATPTVPITVPSAEDAVALVVGELLELPATLDVAEFGADVGRWLTGLTAELTAPLDQPGAMRWYVVLSAGGAFGLYWWWPRPPAPTAVPSPRTPLRPPRQVG